MPSGGQQLVNAVSVSLSLLQFTSSQFAPSLLPPLHLPAPPNLHCPTTLPFRTTQKQLSQELLVQLDPQWLPAERKTEQLENQPGGKKRWTDELIHEQIRVEIKGPKQKIPLENS